MKAKTKKTAVEVGAGALTAAALVSAAAYFLATKEGKRQTAKAKAWVSKARREVAGNVRKARSVGELDFKRIVDSAVKRYGSLEDVNTKEMVRVARDMKQEWSRLKKDAQKMASMAGAKKSAAKKPRAKRPARKTAAKRSTKKSRK